MAKRLTEDDVRRWNREITLSLAWRKQYQDNWDRNIEMLKGKYFSEMADEDRIAVNRVYPHVRVVIPAIYSRNPDVRVVPRRKNDTDSLARKRAEVFQTLLRYYMKELDIKNEAKLCILDGILCGHAWHKVGFETYFDSERPEEEVEDKGTVIDKFLESVGIAQKEEKEELPINEKIVAESPWLLRVSPYDVIVPTLSRRAEEMRWITERFVVPWEYAENNPEWDLDRAGAKYSVDANKLLADQRGSKYKSIDIGNDAKYLIGYEVWDGVEGCVYTLADGAKLPLNEKESEYTYLDSGYHPFTMMRFGEVTDEFYPPSEITMAEPQLHELNEKRTQIHKHTQRYNRKYLTKPGALDNQNKEFLRLGEDGSIIEVTTTYQDEPIETVIQPLADAALPPEVFQVEVRISDDINLILGTTDYVSQAQGGADSATEASIEAAKSKIRVEERIDIVGTFIEKGIRNIAMTAQRFLSQQQIGAVIGDDGIYWVQLTDPREIRGEFAFGIEYGSNSPLSIEADRTLFGQWYQMVVNDPYYDQVKIRLELNRKFGRENPEQWLNEKISQILQEQWLMMAKQGLLLQSPQDASGSPQGSTRVIGQGGGEKLPTGQPRGLPGDRGGRPSQPGSKGGTSLAKGNKTPISY